MADDNKADSERGRATAQLTPNAEGNVMVDVIMGPYRSQRLTMTEADAQAAINGHWARDPNEEYGHHDPLTDEQRADAMTAAHTWAQATWDAAQGVTPPEPPPLEGGDGGVGRKRALRPDEGIDYRTRQAGPKI
jgi:hypothetical protein